MALSRVQTKVTSLSTLPKYWTFNIDNDIFREIFKNVFPCLSLTLSETCVDDTVVLVWTRLKRIKPIDRIVVFVTRFSCLLQQQQHHLQQQQQHPQHGVSGGRCLSSRSVPPSPQQLSSLQSHCSPSNRCNTGAGAVPESVAVQAKPQDCSPLLSISEVTNTLLNQ